MQNELTFTDHPFHVMTKPIGPICNLDCEYCYYLHKEDLYPKGNRWRMEDSCLETYIRDYMKAQPKGAEEVTFAWQGGEPTLMGLEFFQRCVELQRKHARPNLKITNTLQTNGVLLDDDWCRFFRANEFLIGLSIDGPADLHDRYRVDHQGKGSHCSRHAGHAVVEEVLCRVQCAGRGQSAQRRPRCENLSVSERRGMSVRSVHPNC